MVYHVGQNGRYLPSMLPDMDSAKWKDEYLQFENNFFYLYKHIQFFLISWSFFLILQKNLISPRFIYFFKL